jgi:hypothetical protein
MSGQFGCLVWPCGEIGLLEWVWLVTPNLNTLYCFCTAYASSVSTNNTWSTCFRRTDPVHCGSEFIKIDIAAMTDNFTCQPNIRQNFQPQEWRATWVNTCISKCYVGLIPPLSIRLQGLRRVPAYCLIQLHLPSLRIFPHINFIKGGAITRNWTHVIITLLRYAAIASRAKKLLLETKTGYILSLDAINRLHCADKWIAGWNVLVAIHLNTAVMCNIIYLTAIGLSPGGSTHLHTNNT